MLAVGQCRGWGGLCWQWDSVGVGGAMLAVGQCRGWGGLCWQCESVGGEGGYAGSVI